MRLALWHCVKCGLLYHLRWPSMMRVDPTCKVCERKLTWLGAGDVK